MNILITGAKSQLGQEFERLHNNINGKIILTDKDEIDICSIRSINNYIKHTKLDYIINCAAYTDVNNAEIERKKSLLINSYGVKNLVDYCIKTKTKLIHISTDYVYGSNSLEPILEQSIVNPLNYYGFSKREGEKHIEKSNLESIIIRTSWLYSKFGENFVKTIINKSKTEKEINVVNDQFGCPTYTKDLALDILKIINTNSKFNFKNKIFNYSNLGYCNWFDLARTIKLKYGFKSIIKPVPTSFFKSEIKRPRFSITSKQKIIDTFKLKIKNWDMSLTDFLDNDFK